jgi:8-oxo-dGTP pyrophosphatase MutT (NUDIX family)
VDLVDLITGHRPADTTEAEHLAEVRGLVVLHCADARKRTHYEPGHLTASAFVLSPDRASVALVHHAKLGIWVQPGGHFEPDDETPEAAARREVAEEIGLTDLESLGLVDVDVHRIPARADEPAHRHHDLRFGFVAVSTELVAGDGVTEARWVPVDDLGDVDPGVRRAVAKLRPLA